MTDITGDQLLTATQAFEQLVAEATTTYEALSAAGFSEDEEVSEETV